MQEVKKAVMARAIIPNLIFMVRTHERQVPCKIKLPCYQLCVAR
jgi:hypothetical protein